MFQPLEILKALSDMNRLRIVAALSRYEELCACQITEVLQVTGATASRHLSVLTHAGLLDSRKEGRWVYFSLAPPADTEAVFDWMGEAFSASDVFQNDLQLLDKIVEITREDLCRQQRGEACCPTS
ncbi:MAG: ArsR family transcriptional regulator [Candidatus Promineifilaceae bacterium]|jgi:ArsR family transcriptional regulator, arsenate/arsenite/antimonite-responsive transcriptional repressor